MSTRNRNFTSQNKRVPSGYYVPDAPLSEDKKTIAFHKGMEVNKTHVVEKAER